LGVRPPLVSLFLSGISVCRSFFKARSSEYQRHALKHIGHLWGMKRAIIPDSLEVPLYLAIRFEKFLYVNRTSL